MFMTLVGEPFVIVMLDHGQSEKRSISVASPYKPYGNINAYD
jgi:hypothetical protein